MTLTVLSLTVFFPVTDIQVTGETRYAASQILEVSALQTGDNLLLADTANAADRIRKQLPYIGKVTVSRRLPGTLVIQVAESAPTRALEREEGYLLLNEENKVVDEAADKPAGLLLIRGMETEPYEKGRVIAFSNTQQEELLDSLLERLQRQSLPVTLLDLSDIVQIRFVLDNRILIKFGAATDLDKKLGHMLATCQQLAAGAAGTLDMSWWTVQKKDAYFKQEALAESWLVPAVPAGEGEDGPGGQAPEDTPAVPNDPAALSASEPPEPAASQSETSVASGS
ncbi:MAG: FtsQ-type POTRA domain-containing protein [Clostridiales bacterium]|nr:FtsQ-type POTRA domain-containing protein [Clostridiales bacterium]